MFKEKKPQRVTFKAGGTRVEIVNRSAWATPALQVLAKWIVPLAGIDQPFYTIVVRDCKAQTWGGHGGRREQSFRLDRHYRRAINFGAKPRTKEGDQQNLKNARRRLAAIYKALRAEGEDRDSDGWIFDKDRKAALFEMEVAEHRVKYTSYPMPAVQLAKLWPQTVKDSRFQWSAPEIYQTRFEILIMLMAHEAYHASAGHPDKFIKRGPSRGKYVDRASMEYRCNKFAAETVAEFRAHRREIMAQIRQAMRRAQPRRIAATTAAPAPAPAIDKAAQSEAKAEHAAALLKKWEAKQRAAAKKIAKYRRQVNYHTKRAASIRGA